MERPSNSPSIGFVVAGGRSVRMGRDKALLPWRGTSLLDHALSRLGQACDETRILCGPGPRYLDRGVKVHLDAREGEGPLGGILAGLRISGGAVCLFLAVDLPNAPVEFLKFLLGLSEGWDAVVPVHSGGPEPLCAVYRASCLEAISERMRAGDLKMTAFWPLVRLRRVSEAEIRPFGDPAQLFQNLNSPEDL